MNIVEKRLNELKPYENNPRINDGAVKFVKNSIEEFGFKVPIVIDKDGVIVAGHTRYKASQELGLETLVELYKLQRNMEEYIGKTLKRICIS